MKNFEFVVTNYINIFFCNNNKAMNLTGHCHYAKVRFEFQTITGYGFPSFKNTNNEIKEFIRGELKLVGFSGTNEDLIKYIHNEVKNKFKFIECNKYNVSRFILSATKLKVMGVEDANNHDDGFTTYVIRERIGKKKMKAINSFNINAGNTINDYTQRQYMDTVLRLIQKETWIVIKTKYGNFAINCLITKTQDINYMASITIANSETLEDAIEKLSKMHIQIVETEEEPTIFTR